MWENAPVIVMFAFLFGGGAMVKMFTSWNETRLEIMRLKMQGQSSDGNSGLRAEVDSLRAQVNSLRDTTTQYDLSFDTSLQQMEQRMRMVEQRVNNAAAERENSAIVRH